MDNDEVRISQLAKQLHANIDRQLTLIIINTSSANIKSLLNDIQQFQPCPQLLYKNLERYTGKLLKSYLSPRCSSVATVCEIFYTLGKVVGTKKILNFMKTDINLIPLLISKFNNQIHWHEEYLVLCFLVVLCYVPFALDTLEGNVKSSLYSIGYSYLQTAGPLQSLGSRLLGTLVMRRDCDELFILFIDDFTTKYPDSADVTKNGLLQALNIALQNDSESKFLQNIEKVYHFLHSVEHDESKVASIAKIYSKLARYLSENDAYGEVEDILGFFDRNFSNKSTETRIVLSKKFSKLLTNIDAGFAIEVILDFIQGTKDLLAKEPIETTNAEFLHSQLLTIAELLRLKLIDKTNYGDIKEVVSNTLFFQQQRITFISGSNVRDASNYVIWSLARADKELEPEIVGELVLKLLLVSTFDREILIRRAATAALQELVGRHGMKTWRYFYPDDTSDQNSLKSVKIVEALDFVELGSIEKSYFKMPLELVKIFPDFKSHFIEFLTNNVFNLDNDLAKLSARALPKLLKDQPDTSIQQVIRNLIQRSDKKTFNSFIGLSEVLPLTKDTTQLHDILPTFNKIKINHHKDPPFVLEAYLYLLSSLLRLNHIPNGDYFVNLFDAIRADNDNISLILQDIVPLIQISGENWKKWLHYMKNNNLNTAKTVSHVSCFRSNFKDVLELLENERTDCNVKAAILHSISNFLKDNKLKDEELKELVNQLDDYAISEQGDVGSKVRGATISLISKNLEEFTPHLNIIEPKLLRLSSEPIDRLRLESLTLIIKIKNQDSFELHKRDLEKYYKNLLRLYYRFYINDEELSKEFWKGYIFSGGALKATDTLITSTLHAFVEFYEKQLSDDQKKEVLLQLAAILKVESDLLKGNGYKSQRLNKLIIVGLQFYSRILQLNISIPECFNLKGLYVRVYNLHLNTQSITRLNCAIKIFGYLTVVHNLKEARDRLVWLVTSHAIARVRVLASEELFTVYTEKSLTEEKGKYANALETLASVDWNGKGLKKHGEVINID